MCGSEAAASDCTRFGLCWSLFWQVRHRPKPWGTGDKHNARAYGLECALSPAGARLAGRHAPTTTNCVPCRCTGAGVCVTAVSSPLLYDARCCLRQDLPARFPRAKHATQKQSVDSQVIARVVRGECALTIASKVGFCCACWHCCFGKAASADAKNAEELATNTK